MKNQTTKKFLSFSLLIVLCTAMVFLVSSCAPKSVAPSAAPTTEATQAVQEQSPSTAADGNTLPNADITTIGEGKTVFSFKIIFPKCDEKFYLVHTDETTVGAALLALGLIQGENSEYGLYVTTVGGETLDYNTDKMFWAFYIGDDMAMTGVDQTDIVPDAIYSLEAQKG